MGHRQPPALAGPSPRGCQLVTNARGRRGEIQLLPNGIPPSPAASRQSWQAPNNPALRKGRREFLIASSRDREAEGNPLLRRQLEEFWHLPKEPGACPLFDSGPSFLGRRGQLLKSLTRRSAKSHPQKATSGTRRSTAAFGEHKASQNSKGCSTGARSAGPSKQTPSDRAPTCRRGSPSSGRDREQGSSSRQVQRVGFSSATRLPEPHD